MFLDFTVLHAIILIYIYIYFFLIDHKYHSIFAIQIIN